VNADQPKLAITTERMSEVDRVRSDAMTIDRDSQLAHFDRRNADATGNAARKYFTSLVINC